MKIKNLIVFVLFTSNCMMSQTYMQNPYGRKNTQLLNGKWNAIIDPFSKGNEAKFYLNKTPKLKSDFIEYSFDPAFRLNVPGDFNSQLPELKYYEGDVWYQRKINVIPQKSKRQFLYFAGVNYLATIWLNGVKLGTHEGGFSPFQFEITSLLTDSLNDLVVKVNNNRKVDGIPAMSFDWWNYGGILRDVFLIETSKVYISDYKLQLKKGSQNLLEGYIKLDGATSPQQVEFFIPELKINKKISTDTTGLAAFEIKAKPQLWEPGSPKMYDIVFAAGTDQVSDEIGFRTIETKGCDILLNGKPIFLKGVNFHEEIPQRMGRAYSETDAAMILNEVKALGCNYARTAHYPQNERIVRMAEKMGIMLWEEIPLWQGIEFTNPVVLNKAENMLREMIYRDKNRAGIILWSVANETRPSNSRNKVLTDLINLARTLDNSRLITTAFNNLQYDKEKTDISLNDTLINMLDVVGINEYLWWYTRCHDNINSIKFNVAANKPLIISEFGGEAVYGQSGKADEAHSWSEEYQEALYKKQVGMFKNIPNLRGVSPWVLFDFRSPSRLNTLNQDGWNRKGLVSDKGQRKKAWYVMRQYYDELGK